jgi:CheY-like chemotaxis protein
MSNAWQGKVIKMANVLRVASDGEQALRMLRRRPPYENLSIPILVLLDLNLPKRDSREILEEIKNDPILKAIPVVVLSGSRAEAEVARSPCITQTLTWSNP